MTNRILGELEFEKYIKDLTDRELIEFVARQQYEMAKLCPVHNRDIKSLKDKERHQRAIVGTTGGISALIGATIGAILDYFMRR